MGVSERLPIAPGHQGEAVAAEAREPEHGRDLLNLVVGESADLPPLVTWPDCHSWRTGAIGVSGCLGPAPGEVLLDLVAADAAIERSESDAAARWGHQTDRQELS